MPPTKISTKAAVATATLCFLASGLFQAMAWLHWRSLFPLGGVVCGEGLSVHCDWCFAAPSAAALGLMALTAPAFLSSYGLVRAKQRAST